MRQLYSFIVGDHTSKLHVMVIDQFGNGVINIQASDPIDAMAEVGVSSKKMHPLYNKLYPEGWDIEWVWVPEDHPDVRKSINLNRLKMLN